MRTECWSENFHRLHVHEDEWRCRGNEVGWSWKIASAQRCKAFSSEPKNELNRDSSNFVERFKINKMPSRRFQYSIYIQIKKLQKQNEWETTVLESTWKQLHFTRKQDILNDTIIFRSFLKFEFETITYNMRSNFKQKIWLEEALTIQKNKILFPLIWDIFLNVVS